MTDALDLVPEDVDEDALVVAVEGFSGPLDVLLVLARKQKVDLTKISVLTLVKQYMAFLDEALRRRLDLAADYLVTASWLAYLKSRLLLPAEEEPEAEEALALAEALTERLQRLEAIRGAVVQLRARARLGVGRLARGAPEGPTTATVDVVAGTLPELLRAYARAAGRSKVRRLRMERRPEVVPIDVARDALRAAVTDRSRWQRLEDALPSPLRRPTVARSGVASGFAAALELARTAEIEVRQSGTFQPLYLRAR